jgi:hypothetical protein
MNCHMFSTGFGSGHFGGSGMMVMFSGTSSLPVCLIHQQHAMGAGRYT